MRVFCTYTMDFTAMVEVAQRSSDGQWFSRVKGRGRFGYAWSAWQKSSSPDTERTGTWEDRSVRLPASDAAQADSARARTVASARRWVERQLSSGAEVGELHKVAERKVAGADPDGFWSAVLSVT